MFTVKAVGLLLLSFSGAAVLGAVGLGVTATTHAWQADRVITATVLLAAFAELCFWGGSALYGVSVMSKKKAALFGAAQLLRSWRFAGPLLLRREYLLLRLRKI